MHVGEILKWVFVVAWIAHGLGTVANATAAWGLNIGFPDKAPLLPALGSRPTRYFMGFVWLAVSVGYIAAAVGLILGAPWWHIAAWIAAPISIAMILVYWPAVPAAERYTGQFVNLATIVYLILGPK